MIFLMPKIKFNYYLKNIEKSLKIIENANQYIKQFKDLEQERLIYGIK